MNFKIFGFTYNFEWRLLTLHIIYFVLLLSVYTTYIVVIYGYSGFTDAMNINKAIFSPFIIIAAFVLLRNNGLPSYFFLNIIILLTVTPSLVIFSGSDLPFSFIAVTWIAFALLAMVTRFVTLRRIRARHINTTVMLRWLSGLNLLFIASYFAFGGGRFINFDLSLVYDFRRDAAANLPSIYGYLMSNFSKAIVPMGIALSLFYRKWVLLLIFVFCSIMLFALSSNKSPIFIPFVVIFIYWFSRHPKAINLTIIALITVVVIGGVDFFLSQSGVGGITGWFGSLMVRRALLVPSLVTWSHYDFFSFNPYVYWADSNLTFNLVDRTYDINIAELIGREVFRSNTHANTGWIGSGMANAGYVGIALYSFVIAVLLSLLDAYAKIWGYSLILAVFLISVMTAAAGSDLPTTFLNHGLLSLLLMMILLKPKLKQSQIKFFKRKLDTNKLLYKQTCAPAK